MSEFILGDCMEYMQKMPDKAYDLAIVDPPYGINLSKQSMGAGGGVAKHKNRSSKRMVVDGGCMTGNGVAMPNIYHAFDDTAIPTEEYFKELERVSKHRIIWGGNYFLDYLGKTKCFIVWDKGRRGMAFSDAEIAWSDIDDNVRIFNFVWNGMLQEDMKHKEERIHPTQKPVALYEWLLTRYATKGDKILDTHVGSASSLIACENLGFEYTGFEIDPVFYKNAQERMKEYSAQLRMDL